MQRVSFLRRLAMADTPLDLLATIEEACDIGAPRAREKGLDLLVDMGDELPAWVRGDIRAAGGRAGQPDLPGAAGVGG